MYLLKNPNKPGEYEVWKVSDNTIYFKLVVDEVIKQEHICSVDEAVELRAKLTSKGWTDVYDEALLRAAHKKGIFNKAELLSGPSCSCFFCLRTYAPSEIEEWVDKTAKPGRGFYPPDQTAVCPHCGIDAVLSSEAGFELTGTFLAAMHAFYFQRFTSRPGPESPSPP